MKISGIACEVGTSSMRLPTFGKSVLLAQTTREKWGTRSCPEHRLQGRTSLRLRSGYARDDAGRRIARSSKWLGFAVAQRRVSWVQVVAVSGLAVAACVKRSCVVRIYFSANALFSLARGKGCGILEIAV